MVRSWLLIAVAVAGCAAMKQGWHEAQHGIEPNMAAIPEGQGWACYIASDMAWHACARTMEECREDRARFQKDALSQGLFKIKFGECQQAVQAWCTTSQTMAMQSDGSAKPAPSADCMPDQMSCNNYMELNRNKSGLMRVSNCVAVN